MRVIFCWLWREIYVSFGGVWGVLGVLGVLKFRLEFRIMLPASFPSRESINQSIIWMVVGGFTRTFFATFLYVVTSMTIN